MNIIYCESFYLEENIQIFHSIEFETDDDPCDRVKRNVYLYCSIKLMTFKANVCWFIDDLSMLVKQAVTSVRLQQQIEFERR